MPVADVRTELRAVRDEIAGALGAAIPWNEAYAACAAALPGLRALFEDACDRYEDSKRERQALDFLDLELSAVASLDGHAEVAARCRRRYRHLMVNESQEVSPIQARLIGLLVGEGAGRPRLFLVGDEKQSIYGFRGADVRHFRELRDVVRQGIAPGRVETPAIESRQARLTTARFRTVKATPAKSTRRPCCEARGSSFAAPSRLAAMTAIAWAASRP